MANDLTGNPLKVDTAAAITTHPTHVFRMVWTPTTAGDDILVEDNGGSDLWAYKAIAADSNQAIAYEREFNSQVNGITVTTIDHGTLYIYIR
jgi:hypothetical protein